MKTNHLAVAFTSRVALATLLTTALWVILPAMERETQSYDDQWLYELNRVSLAFWATAAITPSWVGSRASKARQGY